MSSEQRVAVVGAGLMGHGIALTFARAGNPVQVYDPETRTLESLFDRIRESMELLEVASSEITDAIARVEICATLESAVKEAAFVFEAAPEKLPLKQSLFSQIEDYAPADAILASNTSVIQISKIMGDLSTKHRALGTHWWNPPHQIPLVEVIKTQWCDSSAARQMYELLERVGKTPVMVEKDVPGFIGNRLQHALWREAISLVENGICTADAVDEVVKASFGRRLAVLGPLENADLVGIELTQDIHRQVLFDLESSGEPSAYLQKLRDEGRNGMAAGAGFREWSDSDLSQTKTKVAEHLKKLETILPD